MFHLLAYDVVFWGVGAARAYSALPLHSSCSGTAGRWPSCGGDLLPAENSGLGGGLALFLQLRLDAGTQEKPQLGH